MPFRILETDFHDLTDQQRMDAKEAARTMVRREVGGRPQRAAFNGTGIQEYPAWVMRFVVALLLTVFIAAALPSLFRLYVAGSEYFQHGITDAPIRAAIVGVSTFVLAEFLIIVSTLAAGVLYKGRSRAWFAVPILMGLSVALVGNWTVTQPGWDLFGWLETLVPPLAVLFISLIGERLMLSSIKQRHRDERAYLEAVRDWQHLHHNPESHPQWLVIYGRSLKAALIDANQSGNGSTERKRMMASMSNRHWGQWVRHEMAVEAGAWLDASEAEPAPKAVPVIPAPTFSRNGAH